MLREYVNISIVPEDNTSQNSNSDEVQVRSEVKHKHQKEPSCHIPSDLFQLENIFTPD